MRRKTASDRKTVRDVGVGGGSVEGRYVCAAPAPTPRGVPSWGVDPQRSRKEPERRLCKPFLKTYCVLCPGSEPTRRELHAGWREAGQIRRGGGHGGTPEPWGPRVRWGLGVHV